MYIRLEHVNVTSPNPQKTSNWMQKVFGWTILWEGVTQMVGIAFMLEILIITSLSINLG